MDRKLVLCLLFAACASVGWGVDAEARLVTVRFSHEDSAGVTAFRIYVRADGLPFGSPAYEGLPPVVDGVYAAAFEVPDDAILFASATATNEIGESALSNEILLAPPGPLAAVCGDGSLDPGEQCDDGNRSSGDGCDAACAVEIASSPLLPYAVNVGGGNYLDPDGRLWWADSSFTSEGTPGTASEEIDNTALDAMYQSRRYGDLDGSSIAFELPVEEPGLYAIRLHFADVGSETTGPGQRVFSLLVDDALWIRDLDVFAAAGPGNALQRDFSVYVSRGRFTLRLVPQLGRPMLSGIEIRRADLSTPDAFPSAPRVVICDGYCL